MYTTGVQMSLKQLKLAVVGIFICGAVHAQAGVPATCAAFQSSVTATISSSNGVVTVTPDTACVTAGGTMKWKAGASESWTTDFNDDPHSAFSPGHKHHHGKGNNAVGGKVRACSQSDASYNASAGGCVFQYKATHTTKGAQSSTDPQVIIKPGT